MTRKTPSQGEVRRAVRVGPTMGDVSPVMYWYKHDHFKTEDEARGAFKLAYQQGLDGMGESTQSWMGLTNEQYSSWMRDESLPARSRRR